MPNTPPADVKHGVRSCVFWPFYLMAVQYCNLFNPGVKHVTHPRRLEIPPDSEFIMTTEDVQDSSAMSAIQELMINLHQALEQDEKGSCKDS